MELEDDNCVKVSGTYFHFLIAKGQLLNIKDQKYWETVYKYIELEKIYYHVKKILGTPSYILMSIEDIKYLVNYIMDGLKHEHVFIKSEIKAKESATKLGLHAGFLQTPIFLCCRLTNCTFSFEQLLLD